MTRTSLDRIFPCLLQLLRLKMLPKRGDRGQVALNRFSRLFTPNGKMKQVCFVIDGVIKKIVSKITNKYHAFFILLLLVTRLSRILRLFQFGLTFP